MLDPLIQVGLLLAAPTDTTADTRHVFPDYLSYTIAFLADETRFKLKTKERASDAVRFLIYFHSHKLIFQ